MGIFYTFVPEASVKLIGVEAAGRGLNRGEHGASLAKGEPGVLHGAKSYLLQDDDGQVMSTYSVAPGLDYPGVGPEHSYYKDTGRATYVTVNDKQAMKGFKLLCELEGIIPALESAHAVYYAAELAAGLSADKLVVVNLSGRGDKDIEVLSQFLEEKNNNE